MFLTPFNYIFVYSLAALGLVLIAARNMMLNLCALILLLMPFEVLIRLVNIIL